MLSSFSIDHVDLFLPAPPTTAASMHPLRITEAAMSMRLLRWPSRPRPSSRWSAGRGGHRAHYTSAYLLKQTTSTPPLFTFKVVVASIFGPMAVHPPSLRLLAAVSRTVLVPRPLRSVKRPKSGDSSRPSPLLFHRPTRLPGGGSRTAYRLRCVVARWTCRTRRSKISSIRFDRAIDRPRSMLS